MTQDEFNEIANNGALAHPSLLIRTSRAYICLWHIIETVPDAEQAFLQWCRACDRLQGLDQ